MCPTYLKFADPLPETHNFFFIWPYWHLSASISGRQGKNFVGLKYNILPTTLPDWARFRYYQTGNFLLWILNVKLLHTKIYNKFYIREDNIKSPSLLLGNAQACGTCGRMNTGSPVANPEGVRANPPLRQIFFIFMENFQKNQEKLMKIQVKLTNWTPNQEILDLPLVPQLYTYPLWGYSPESGSKPLSRHYFFLS